MEGYGVGTISLTTFREIAGMVPIQRSEHDNLREARAELYKLMEENRKVEI